MSALFPKMRSASWASAQSQVVYSISILNLKIREIFIDKVESKAERHKVQ
jgi:hypothetical protein